MPPGPYALNRRAIDVAIKDWVRTHKSDLRSIVSDNELETVGQFMMDIGAKLNELDDAPEDDQEAMNRRVEAVFRYRQVTSLLLGACFEIC